MPLYLISRIIRDVIPCFIAGDNSKDHLNDMQDTTWAYSHIDSGMVSADTVATPSGAYYEEEMSPAPVYTPTAETPTTQNSIIGKSFSIPSNS